MFLKLYNFTLLFILMFSTILVSSSSSWLISWFALEINLMSFVPLLIMNPTPSTSEASIKYFLTQALASSILILASISMFKLIPSNTLASFNWLIIIALGIKSGMAPTHFWFPQVMELISWMQGLIVLTWQKIAPLLLMFSVSNSMAISFLIIMSSIFGAIGGFNINSIKKIMTFSSIAHLAWMASSSSLNMKVWFIYFMVYSLISASLIIPFHMFSVDILNNLNSILSNKMLKTFIFFNLLSLGGMPPLLGIVPKILIMSSLLNLSKYDTTMIVILIASSVVTLFFYIKMTYSIIMLNNPATHLYKSNYLMSSLPLTILFSISILGNLTIPVTVSLI